MIRLVIASMALLGLAACASSTPEKAESAADNSDVTGSVVVAKNTQASDSPVDIVDIPKDETVVATAEADTMICRKVRTVGTNRTTRVCRTRGQIAAERDAARDTLREHQMRTSGAVGGE